MSKEFDAILKNLKKDLGEEIFSWGPKFESAKGIPTGSEDFDMMTGIGGWPTNRIIEIAGPPSSGKTSWSLYVARRWKETFNDERPIVIIDTERTIDERLLVGLGHDPAKMAFVYPADAEAALNTLLRIVETGVAGFVILDSVDGLVPRKILENDIGDATMGLQAKQLGETMRRLSKAVVEKNVTVVFLNHLKDNLSPYAPPKTTPGGTAIPYYSSFRVWLNRSKPSQDVEGAFTLKAKIVKNKCAEPRDGDTEFNFIYGKGPDPLMNLIGAAKTLGVLKFAGSSVKIATNADLDNPSYEAFALGGKKGLYEKLQTEPELQEKLRALVKVFPRPEN